MQITAPDAQAGGQSSDDRRRQFSVRPADPKIARSGNLTPPLLTLTDRHRSSVPDHVSPIQQTLRIGDA